MLNISLNSIRASVDAGHFKSLDYVEKRRSGRVLIRLVSALFILIFIVMFIPWTQNIRSRGLVTTLKPGQRPQTIHSVIDGRIENWFVQEGDFVQKGDTVLLISEVKDDYFDPGLLARTEQQIQAKGQAVGAYSEKAGALDNQIEALRQTGQLKLQQAQNKLQQVQLKVVSDSMDYRASEINFQIAKEQFERIEPLYQSGLKSLTELENRKLKMQKAQAEMIAYANKLGSSRNELLNAQVEILSIQTQYRDEIAKAESERFTALSSKYDAEATMTKLQNQYTNYSVRMGMYCITAPLDGYITKAIQSGIGEMVKSGTEIVSIMPARYDLAVEMYVKPIDLPLLEKGQPLRIQFDGWPAIVFSGWPNTSFGTYGGRVFAIDNFISENGLYRVLVAPDSSDAPWPEGIRVGAGADNMVLLKDVPIWYELWRQINGFPPDYYKNNPKPKNKKS